MATDPVCRKEVDEENAPGGKVHYWNNVLYFCSENCRKAFRREPQKYAPATLRKKLRARRIKNARTIGSRNRQGILRSRGSGKYRMLHLQEGPVLGAGVINEFAMSDERKGTRPSFEGIHALRL